MRAQHMMTIEQLGCIIVSQHESLLGEGSNSTSPPLNIVSKTGADIPD